MFLENPLQNIVFSFMPAYFEESWVLETGTVNVSVNQLPYKQEAESLGGPSTTWNYEKYMAVFMLGSK
jgi:hypothetical protein